MRRAARRDITEPEIIRFARELGAWLVPLDEPVDWLLAWRGQWYLVEIKQPHREGHLHEFTEAQRQFQRQCGERGMRIHVWRTDADVLATLGAKVGA
jgi:hypothetical protein